MPQKKKTKKSKKAETKNPSNRYGSGPRAKNRPRDNLFIGDQFGLPDSMYRYKDPNSAVNLQPLQNEIAQIRNYIQQQDSRMQIDIPSDLVRGPQLDMAIKKLSNDLLSKLTPPKPDIVMKEQEDPILEKRKALAERIKEKKATKSQGTGTENKMVSIGLDALDFIPKKPQMIDQISEASATQIDLIQAKAQIPSSGSDRLRGSRQQKRQFQKLKDQDEGQQRLLIQQRKLQLEEEKNKLSERQNQLLQDYTKVLQQKNQNPINVNYNVANNTSNFTFQQNTDLTRKQYFQKNNFENKLLQAYPQSNPLFEDLGEVQNEPSSSSYLLQPPPAQGLLMPPPSSSSLVLYED